MQVGEHSGNQAQLDLLARLLEAAARRELPVWLGGGWAIDARLGRITRAHDDLDLTYPAARHDEFVELIGTLGATVTGITGYGFLADRGGVLLDCEPAHWTGTAWEVGARRPAPVRMQPKARWPACACAATAGRRSCGTTSITPMSRRRRSGRPGTCTRTGSPARQSGLRRWRGCARTSTPGGTAHRGRTTDVQRRKPAAHDHCGGRSVTQVTVQF